MQYCQICPPIRNMHPYSAQRLISLLDVMNKRYRNLVDRDEEYESENNLILLLLDTILNCIQPNMLQHNLALMYALLQRQRVIKSMCSVETTDSASVVIIKPKIAKILMQ